MLHDTKNVKFHNILKKLWKYSRGHNNVRHDLIISSKVGSWKIKLALIWKVRFVSESELCFRKIKFHIKQSVNLKQGKGFNIFSWHWFKFQPNGNIKIRAKMWPSALINKSNGTLPDLLEHRILSGCTIRTVMLLNIARGSWWQKLAAFRGL